jgi:phage shock protein E|tara:strand:- start:154 stop:477 length:324 start_codon:yes stop_codon:yes gene_type:complete
VKKLVLILTFIFISLSSVSKELIIDVRTFEEWDQGHLSSAKRIEWQEISKKIQDLDTNKDDQIILYCRSGKRAEKAKIILNGLGYMDVVNAGSLLEAKTLTGDFVEK